jgi:hypothetical protein
MHLEWDGAYRLGPVALGMSLEEVAEIVPGKSSVANGGESASAFWESSEVGLTVQFYEDVAVSISARRQFWVGGENLIGLTEGAAVRHAGPEVSREGDEGFAFVRTASGLELSISDGVVTAVDLQDFDRVPE